MVYDRSDGDDDAAGTDDNAVPVLLQDMSFLWKPAGVLGDKLHKLQKVYQHRFKDLSVVDDGVFKIKLFKI